MSIETCSHPWGTEVLIGHIDNSAEPSALNAGVVTDTGSVDEGSRGSLLILKLLRSKPHLRQLLQNRHTDQGHVDHGHVGHVNTAGQPCLEGQPGLALQEAADDLALDLLQVKLLQGLPASLHVVLAVGENQWNQVPLYFVADDVQVGNLRGIDGVAGDR